MIHTAPEHCEYNRIRSLPPFARRLLLALLRGALRRSTETVALSGTHAVALERVGLRAGRILPLPVAPARHPRSGRHAAGRPSRLGFAGELSALKGADDLPVLLRTLTPRFGFASPAQVRWPAGWRARSPRWRRRSVRPWSWSAC